MGGDFRRWLQLLLLVAIGPALQGANGLVLYAQGKTLPESEPASSFGSVTGHVYLAGNNTPARLVNVALQPLQVQLPPRQSVTAMGSLSFTLHQTNLEGEYLIPRVRPGTYYVIVSVPGLLSPFAQFTAEEMAHPTPEVAKRIADTLPVVAVKANNTAVLDLHLERGAGMSGTVRFDDGTPFMNATLNVERHRSDGKWASPQINYSRTTADVDGHWEISGLGPGEYRVRVSLELSERRQSALLGNSISSSGTTLYALRYYSGDTARERDAKAVKLEEGEQANGQDVTIAVSKLHAVTGALVDAQSGQALNAGRVDMLYADGDDSLNSVDVDPDTRTFTFPFVPEGQYRLRTSNGREVRFDPAAEVQQGTSDPQASTTLKAYDAGEVPLTVGGEMTGVTLPLEARGQAH